MDTSAKFPGNLLIIDDVYPHPRAISSWRGVEFDAYLQYFQKASIFSSMSHINLLGTETKEDVLDFYVKNYSHSSDSFLIWDPGKKDDCMDKADMAYFVFLNNVWDELNTIEEHKLPFAFELYPGGGFALGNEESDDKLRTVMSSPFFRGVIVSNYIVYDYLLEKQFCPENQILLVTGCVVNHDSLPKNVYDKRYYGFDKNTFDIAFTAYRYSAFGVDKGYDIFVEVSKILHNISDKFHFHVVGNFDENILDVAELGNNIHFYGPQGISWFNSFYQNMDVLISPNQSSVLAKGTFDGFPTGCGIDAIIRKVVLIATDDLSQNNGQYRNAKDMYIVAHNTQIILNRILFLYNHPHLLKEIGANGSSRARYIYSFEKQLEPRLLFLNQIMKTILSDKKSTP